MSTDPKAVVREFATICAATQMAHTLYWHLFEQDQHRLRLYDEIAPSRSPRSEPTSKSAGLHLKKRLRLSHTRGPPQFAMRCNDER